MMKHVTSRRFALVIVSCSGVLMSGCARLGAMSRSDPATIAVYSGGDHSQGTVTSPETRANMRHGCALVRGPHDYHIGAINLDCFRFPEDWPDSDHPWPTSEQAAARVVEAVTDRVVSEVDRRLPTPATARSEPSLRPLLAYARAASSLTDRNRLAAILMKHSDDVCTIEMGRITANQATVNTTLSILTTGLTAAANIVTGELAGSILTGGANFTSGSRDAINAHVYRNTFAFAISRAITLERRAQREAIEGRYSETLDKFTIDDAVRAANLYHSQCSFYKGLELVLSSVEGRDNFNRALRDRERQLQLESLDREIANLDEEVRPRPAGEAAELRTTLDAMRLRRAQLVMAPISTTGSDATNPASPPPPGGQ